MDKSLVGAIGATFLVASATILAQETKAPAPNPSSTATQSRPSLSMGTQMTQMDEHMKKMQALHDRMASAATPEERQKVMEEQRKEMQSGMATMNQMMRGGAMMGGMGGGMTGPKGAHADANTRMQMMQKRMDMMQMMMDQQGMSGNPMGPGAAQKK